MSTNANEFCFYYPLLKLLEKIILTSAKLSISNNLVSEIKNKLEKILTVCFPNIGHHTLEKNLFLFDNSYNLTY